MIRVIIDDERLLPDVWARHDFAPLFGSPYQVLLQEPSGHLRSLFGGGIPTVTHHNGPASLPAVMGGGAGGTGTVTVKRRRSK